MKNFKNYTPEKYSSPKYRKVSDGIYATKNPRIDGEVYVTSMTFEMEPECYGEEDGCPTNITQVPFENLLDEFDLFVSDFYDDLNEKSEKLCYQEFGAMELKCIQNLRTILGKRVYAVLKTDGDDEYEELVIE